MTETFETTTIKSFAAVRADMDEFKRSINEWIIFLDGNMRDARMRIHELERKMAELEAKNGRDEWQ